MQCQLALLKRGGSVDLLPNIYRGEDAVLPEINPEMARVSRTSKDGGRIYHCRYTALKPLIVGGSV